MENRRNHLLRVLGLAFGLAAVVGSVVGQGILRSPGIVAQASGSEWVLIGLWLLGALVALISAMPFAELAAAIPNAGGAIAYTERAFGRRAGIAMALTIIVMYCTTTAMLSFVVGEFLVRLGVGGGKLGPGILGLGALVLFNVVNSVGTRASGGLQVFLSTLKGVVLIGLVVVLFAQPGATPSSAPVAPATMGLLGFGTAMLVIIGTYNGWADLTIYGEELTDPGRTIPRALFGGIIGIAVLYLFVNLAILHVLPPAELARSDFAAADAAGRLFGNDADTVFTAFGVLSVSALTSLGVMTTARLVFAAARDGILPTALAGVDRRGTPLAAMLTSSAFSALFLLSGTYLALSSTTVSLGQAIYVAVMVAAMALRRREPAMPRPWRVPAFGVFVPLAIAINAVLLVVFIVQEPFFALLGFAMVGVLSGGYFLFMGKGHRPVEAGAAD